METTKYIKKAKDTGYIPKTNADFDAVEAANLMNRHSFIKKAKETDYIPIPKTNADFDAVEAAIVAKRRII
jgi:hypothetical protein